MKIGDKVRFIGFDVDGTLTKGYSWHRLHKAMGIKDGEEKELVQQIRSEVLDTFEVGRKITEYYRRYPQNNKEHMMKVLSDWEFEDGAQELIDRLRGKYKLGILSGGPHLFVRNVAETLEVPIWRSTNYVLFDKDGSHFVRIWVEGDDALMKMEYLKEIGRNLGIGPDKMMFVGDSFSDKAAFSYVKYSVLYEHHDDRMNTVEVVEKLKQKTKFVIKNLLDVLRILDSQD